MTRDLLFTLSFIATRASTESADIGTTPFVRRGYRASPIGLLADETNKDAAKGCRDTVSVVANDSPSLRVTRGPVLDASYAGKGIRLRIGGYFMPCAICEHVRAANIRLLRGGGGNGWRGRGTTISIWPAECHSHPFDRYTADRQPTSARGNNESAATGEARDGGSRPFAVYLTYRWRPRGPREPDISGIA